MEQKPFGTDDFADNPEPRVPCVLLLDVSRSMAGQPIEELNAGLVAYKEDLAADTLASKRVEVAVITFGSTATMICNFTTAENFFPPRLEADGPTCMGQAFNLAIDSIEARKQEYKDNGIAYYRPWIFAISDGEPNDQGWESAAARAIDAEKAKAFKTFCVGVENANLQKLSRFCLGEPVRLDGLRFRDMFQWLSSSQQSVSRSTPGEDVPLENPTAPNGWATSQ